MKKIIRTPEAELLALDWNPVAHDELKKTTIIAPIAGMSKVTCTCSRCGAKQTLYCSKARANFERNDGKFLCLGCAAKDNAKKNTVVGLTQESQRTFVEAVCEDCGKQKTIKTASYLITKKHHGGRYICGCEKRKNHKMSEETKEKLRQANLGKHHTEETKAKISKNHSEISKQALLKHQRHDGMLGKKASEETKRKISESNTGKVRTPEQRERYSKALKKYAFEHPMTEEMKRKISDTVTGHYVSGRARKGGWGHSELYTPVKPQPTGHEKPVPFYLRSSWESRLARLLDGHDGVQFWSHELFKVKLPDGMKPKFAVPDFAVVTQRGWLVVIEVKPKKMAETEKYLVQFDVQEKILADMGIAMLVATEEELYPEVEPEDSLWWLFEAERRALEVQPA